MRANPRRFHITSTFQIFPNPVSGGEKNRSCWMNEPSQRRKSVFSCFLLLLLLNASRSLELSLSLKIQSVSDCADDIADDVVTVAAAAAVAPIIRAAATTMKRQIPFFIPFLLFFAELTFPRKKD